MDGAKSRVGRSGKSSDPHEAAVNSDDKLGSETTWHTTFCENSGFSADRKLKIIGTNPIKHDGWDKVTGAAKFSSDIILPGMLVGKMLRRPHPHAIIKSIDTSAAEKLAGVKAVVTRADFPEIKEGTAFGDMTRMVMAREKVLHEGHPVAAVAATSEAIAKRALKLIKVEYEVLPHVIDPVAAMQPGAPILHPYMRTKGAKPARCQGQRRQAVATWSSATSSASATSRPASSKPT